MRLLVISAALWAFNTFAQAPVEISSISQDSVGQRLAFVVKERVRSSSSMSLILDGRPRVHLKLVTLEGNTSNPGDYTVYSAVWVWDSQKLGLPLYLTSSAGYCGTSRIQECAETLVATTYKQWENIVKVLTNASSR